MVPSGKSGPAVILAGVNGNVAVIAAGDELANAQFTADMTDGLITILRAAVINPIKFLVILFIYINSLTYLILSNNTGPIGGGPT
jgi:hypothetical protein